MDIKRAIRQSLSNVLRVTHIALWLTIPSAFWLWLGIAPAPQARSCEPYCGWYQGSVLDVSEDRFLFTMNAAVLAGLLLFVCWMAGYCTEIIGRVMRGEGELPPVERRCFRAGLGQILSSLKYWLPAIVMILLGYLILGTSPWRVADQLQRPLLLLSTPVALALYWGNLVGLARYACYGDRSVMYRREENVRLALSNFKASLALSLLGFIVFKFGLAVWDRLLNLGVYLLDADLMIQTALACFAFFFVLLTGCFVCSWLIGKYAIKIGIGDQLAR